MNATTLATILALAGTSLAGCLGEGPAANGDCAFYPNREYLWEKWGAEVVQTPEEYDGVGFSVAHWGNGPGEEPGEKPNTFVDWDEFPQAARPEILRDVLCAVKGLFKDPQWQDKNPVLTTTAREPVARAAMESLWDEHERQAGVWTEDCCYVRFDSRFYSVGYYLRHTTWGTEHGTNETTFGEGRVTAGAGVPGMLTRQVGGEPLTFAASVRWNLIFVELLADASAGEVILHVQEPGSSDDEWQHRAPGTGPTSPERYQTVTIPFEAASLWDGEWRAVPFANGTAADIEYRIAATVFAWYEDYQPWGGFSAFGDERPA